MTTSSDPKVSIIIPAYNKWELTEQCLQFLSKTTSVPHEIIVVDNASTDGTRAGLKTWANICGIRVWTNFENRNFSGACNQGAELAKSENLIFLNNDTIPFDGWAEPLVEELDKGTGVVGSKLIFPNGTIQHAGVAFMRENRFPYHPYRGALATAPYVNNRREVQVVTGACMAVTKTIFNRCGQFDPDYRNGGEDIDMCLKVYHNLKLPVVYRPDSALIHLESQSPGRMDFNEENCEVFYRQWGESFLADEDAFYYDDGFHRDGFRTGVMMSPLSPFETNNDFYKLPNNLGWLSVAYCQRALIKGDRERAKTILKFVNSWPEDVAVREWAAQMAATMGDYRSAYCHSARAAEVQRVNDAKAANDRFNTVLLGRLRPFQP